LILVFPPVPLPGSGGVLGGAHSGGNFAVTRASCYDLRPLMAALIPAEGDGLLAAR